MNFRQSLLVAVVGGLLVLSVTHFTHSLLGAIVVGAFALTGTVAGLIWYGPDGVRPSTPKPAQVKRPWTRRTRAALGILFCIGVASAVFLAFERVSGIGKNSSVDTVPTTTPPGIVVTGNTGPVTTALGLSAPVSCSHPSWSYPQGYQDFQCLPQNHADPPSDGYAQPSAGSVGSPGTALIVHGDLRAVPSYPGSTQLPCEIRVFRPGETVSHLGNGPAWISEVSNTDAAIQAGISIAQEYELRQYGRACTVTKGE
jgi:hypothetical protein